MFLKYSIVLALPLCFALLNGAARASDKGGIAFILDHGKELNLNEDQKRKLNNMRTLEERTRNKIFAEPDMKATFQKMVVAKFKKDDAGAAEAFGEYVKKLIEKSASVAKGMITDLGNILTPEQIAKIQDIKEAPDGKMKTTTTPEEEKRKPKRGTQPPNPFEL